MLNLCAHCKLHRVKRKENSYCSRGCFTAAMRGSQPWRVLKPAHEASRKMFDRRIVSVIREKLEEKKVETAVDVWVPLDWAVKVALAARKGGYKAGWACRRSRRV